MLEDRKQGAIQSSAAKVLHTFRLVTKFCHQFTQINQAKPKLFQLEIKNFKLISGSYLIQKKRLFCLGTP